MKLRERAIVLQRQAKAVAEADANLKAEANNSNFHGWASDKSGMPGMRHFEYAVPEFESNLDLVKTELNP